mmetsp:Transcript_13240/g.28601  ORF Transcript_13240/g.28601 Transcript_13240/m.28601 type:complete len:214 (-) Transcript_13240:585-1226(-)
MGVRFLVARGTATSSTSLSLSDSYFTFRLAPAECLPEMVFAALPRFFRATASFSSSPSLNLLLSSLPLSPSLSLSSKSALFFNATFRAVVVELFLVLAKLLMAEVFFAFAFSFDGTSSSVSLNVPLSSLSSSSLLGVFLAEEAVFLKLMVESFFVLAVALVAVALVAGFFCFCFPFASTSFSSPSSLFLSRSELSSSSPLPISTMSTSLPSST